jgi:signal transduction histidine kinase
VNSEGNQVKQESDCSQARLAGIDVRPARILFSNLSIGHRLPLLIGSLLLGIIITSIGASYRVVKGAAEEVGSQRLLSLTQQMATRSQQSSIDVLNKTSIAANDQAILAFLQSPSAATRRSLSAGLLKFLPPQDTNSLQVELWNSNHTLALVLPDGASPEPGNLETEFDLCSGDPFKAISAIHIINDIITYAAVAAVRDMTGKPVGYLVRWRRFSAAPDARKQVADLLGSEAAVYLGNSRGDVWTDLVYVVPAPPEGLGPTLEVTHYKREGHSVMALGRPIIGTPWFVVVEFPDQVFLTEVTRFLRRTKLIGFVLLVIGMGGAFLLSRSITKPLNALTDAASEIAGGDYSHIVKTRRNDELGVLAGAFNAMVVKVRDSQSSLELKVQERTAQLNAANKELETFSYSVSHDLRAPLRHINGFSQALEEEYADRLDEQGMHYLREVRSASQEMARLIDDILRLARVTRSEMHTETVNLTEKAKAVFAELQKADLSRTVAIDIEEGLMTRGDQRLLRILLSNLLGNAWKFTSKRKQPRIAFGGEQKDGETQYFVRDNGAGFDMSYVNKLFGAFKRLHRAGEFEGTGIGLATVQRIVHRHGGRVWAEGAVNEGATFYFTLQQRKETRNGDETDLIG